MDRISRLSLYLSGQRTAEYRHASILQKVWGGPRPTISGSSVTLWFILGVNIL